VSTFDNGVLHYDYAAVLCETTNKAEQPVTRHVRCDGKRRTVQHREHWYTSFVAYELSDWPERVYDRETQSCVEAQRHSIILPDARRQVMWSELMGQPYSYDPLLERYSCDDIIGVVYGRDYRTGKVEPEPPVSGYVDVARPCITSVIANDDMPWSGMHAVPHTDKNATNGLPAFYYVVTDIGLMGRIDTIINNNDSAMIGNDPSVHTAVIPHLPM